MVEVMHLIKKQTNNAHEPGITRPIIVLGSVTSFQKSWGSATGCSFLLLWPL